MNGRYIKLYNGKRKKVTRRNLGRKRKGKPESGKER